ARGHHAVQVTDQRQAGLLDAWMANLTAQARGTSHQPYVEPQVRIVQELPHRDGAERCGRGLVRHPRLTYFAVASCDSISSYAELALAALASCLRVASSRSR